MLRTDLPLDREAAGVFLPAILLWLLAVAQRTVSADDPSVAGKDFPALV